MEANQSIAAAAAVSAAAWSYGLSGPASTAAVSDPTGPAVDGSLADADAAALATARAALREANDMATANQLAEEAVADLHWLLRQTRQQAQEIIQGGEDDQLVTGEAHQTLVEYAKSVLEDTEYQGTERVEGYNPVVTIDIRDSLDGLIGADLEEVLSTSDRILDRLVIVRHALSENKEVVSRFIRDLTERLEKAVGLENPLEVIDSAFLIVKDVSQLLKEGALDVHSIQGEIPVDTAAALLAARA